MQTAEEFARIILANCMVDLSYVPPLVKLLERDRNATRLALLEEIREHVAAAYPYGGEWPRRYEALLTHLESKYTQPVQLTKGEKL